MIKQNHALPVLAVAVVVVVAGLAAGRRRGAPEETSARASAWQLPVKPWGDPDLEGTWPLDYINGTPLQRPPKFGPRRFLTDAEFAERAERFGALNARYAEEIASNKMNNGHWVEVGQPNRLTSLVVEPADGRLPPPTKAGERKSATMTSTRSDIELDGPDDFNALERCITRGMPASMFPFTYNGGIEILQAPGYVVIRLELIHESRIVPLDGRARLPSEIRHWMGESRGRFEGDTLVIETTNFNGGSPMIDDGPGAKPIPTSEKLRIVERLTRVDPDTIEYEIEVEDPVTLTGPWKAAFPWKRDQAYRFFEYACHEGNTVVTSMLNATRVERARRAAVAE